MSSHISPVPELLAEIRAGRMVILVDDENRENEGDLILAADHVTAAAIAFMACEGRGLICLSLARPIAERLRLPLLPRRGVAADHTAFTVPIEARTGIETGISAADRAHTIRTAIAADSTADDIITPGHVFPLIARDGGVLERPGHTEASVDLALLAGLTPAAVICEIMLADGTMARLPQLREFAAHHQLRIGCIDDLVAYRRALHGRDAASAAA